MNMLSTKKVAGKRKLNGTLKAPIHCEKYGAKWFKIILPQENMYKHADSLMPPNKFYVRHDVLNPNYDKQLSEWVEKKRKDPPIKIFRSFASYKDKKQWLTIFDKIPISDRTFFEIIRNKMICRGSFDIEWTTYLNESAAPTVKDELDFIRYIWDLYIAPAYLSLGNNDLEYVMNTGSRKSGENAWKTSYHITADVIWQNQTTQNEFIQRTIVESVKADEKMFYMATEKKDGKSIKVRKCKIDMGIYKENMSMRINDCHKADDATKTDMCMVSGCGKSKDMYLTPDDLPTNDIITLDYLNSHIPPSVSLRATKEIKIKKVKDCTELDVDLRDRLFEDLEILIRKNGDMVSYPSNARGLYVICKKKEGTRTFKGCNGHHESNNCRLSLSIKDIKESTVPVRYRCLGEGCNCPKQGAVIGSVGPYDTPKIYSNTFDSNDEFYWLEFVIKHGNIIYPSKEIMETAVLEDAKRVYAIIEKARGTVIRKQSKDQYFDIIGGDEKSNLLIRYEVTEVDEKGRSYTKQKKLTWKQFRANYANRLPLFRDITCEMDPKLMKQCEKDKIFNVWQGLKAKPVTRDLFDKEKIRKIVEHLFIVLANRNVRNFIYIMSWLARILRTPWIKTKTLISFIQEEQQTGRGLFFNWFILCVLGTELGYAVRGVDTFERPWNQFLLGKIFIFIDEVSVDKTAQSKVADILKNLTTESLLQVFKRNTDEIIVRNYLNLAEATNHEEAIRHETGDSRNATFNSSDEKKGLPWLEEVHDIMYNTDAASHFLRWVLDIPESKLAIMKNLPDTSARRKAMTTGVPIPVLFLKDLMDKTYPISPGHIPLKTINPPVPVVNSPVHATVKLPLKTLENGNISGLGLYQAFTQWCGAMGHKPCSNTMFGKLIWKKDSKKNYIKKTIESSGAIYHLDSIKIPNFMNEIEEDFFTRHEGEFDVFAPFCCDREVDIIMSYINVKSSIDGEHSKKIDDIIAFLSNLFYSM
jgi:hypothetical protein